MSKGKFLSCSYGIDCFPTLRPKERRVNPYFLLNVLTKVKPYTYLMIYSEFI